MRPEGDDGEQAEQNWRSAEDGLIGPLALSFDTEMSTDLFESDLDLPATDEPSKDVAGLSLEISSEKGLGLELTFGIADKEPADRDWRNPGAIPNRRATGDLNEAIGSAIPETDSIAFPGNFAILEYGRELFLRFSFDRLPAPAFVLCWREVEQVGIEAQACDDTNTVADGGKELDGCKRAVSDQDDIAIGKPAMDLQRGLTSPIEQRLGGSLLVGIEAFGGSE